MMPRTVTASSSEDSAEDLFTPEFKRLKARNPPPDLSRVIDLDKLNLASQTELLTSSDQGIRLYPVKSCDLKPLVGLKPCEDWRAYSFSNYPGFIVIQNPFVDGYQRYWVHRCLQDFPSDRENVTNLSALGADHSRDLWEKFVQKKSVVFDKQDPLRKLRWTTLGYHYNWTTKEYSEENKAEFPTDVNCLSQYFAACLGFGAYQAQAGIVNYYHLDSTLAGHVDHSELDHCAPLFSISFGQTAIFLLGGITKSVTPISVFLRSGDVCVMSGLCRLAYHAVPKILAPPKEEHISSCFSLTLTVQHKVHDCNSAGVNVCDEYIDIADNGQIVSDCTNAVNSEGDMSFRSDPCVTDKSLVMESSHSYHRHRPFVKWTIKENETVKRNDDQRCDDQRCDEQRCDDQRCDEFLRSYNLNIDQVNYKMREVISALDFSPFEVYLKSSRINLNIRQVLPPGWAKLPEKSSVGENSLCRKLLHTDVEDVYNYNSDVHSLAKSSTDGNNPCSSFGQEDAEFACSENVKKLKTDFT